MKTSTMIIPACLLAALAACSSEPERPEQPRGYFATHVAEDGTRQFQYTLDVSESSNRRGNQRPGNLQGHASGGSSRGVSGGVTAGSSGGRPPRGSGGGREMFEQINRQLETHLERELKDSNFCPTGYRETERVVEPGTVYIRGECTKNAGNGGSADTEVDVAQ